MKSTPKKPHKTTKSIKKKGIKVIYKQIACSPEEMQRRLGKAYDILFDHMLRLNKEKCYCDEPDCAKCLLVNCLDPDCNVHPMERKNRLRNV